MNVLYKFIKTKYWDLIHYHFPYFWAMKLYKIELGKEINFSDPKDINEKILWLEFFTNTRTWSTLADKYAVREYVKSRVGSHILIPLVGCWKKVEDINFDCLPQSFVIKPNNGSYNTIIVQDKNFANINDIKKRLKHSLKYKFGLDNAEPHYLKIKPCIIAEKLLTTDAPEGLVDYKIWCFNGEPYCILTCIGRNSITHHADFVIYDLQWKKHPEYNTGPYQNECSCPKPDNLLEMLNIATKLSQGLPQCRVDLYNVKGKIYFGEMTMTANYGMMPNIIQEILNDMGKHCQLPKRTFTDKYVSFMTRYLPKFR